MFGVSSTSVSDLQTFYGKGAFEQTIPKAPRLLRYANELTPILQGFIVNFTFQCLQHTHF